jgi:hypothetical protein
MLVKFTIDGGSTPIRQQAREDVLNDRLVVLRRFDPAAEDRARQAIRRYLDTHREFTAAHIACTGNADEWYPEFEPLYDALLEESHDLRLAHEEAAKFLGLLVWNEALRHSEAWHFTSYPKFDTEYMVTHYFALDGHIKAGAKLNQAASARRHGDTERAEDLEQAARRLMARWGRT